MELREIKFDQDDEGFAERTNGEREEFLDKLLKTKTIILINIYIEIYYFGRRTIACIEFNHSI
jgi:hypothetical protein